MCKISTTIYRSAGWEADECSYGDLVLVKGGAPWVVRLFLEPEDKWIYLEGGENGIFTGETYPDGSRGEIGLTWKGGFLAFNDKWEGMTYTD